VTASKGIKNHCKAIAAILSMAEAVNADSEGHRWHINHLIAQQSWPKEV